MENPVSQPEDTAMPAENSCAHCGQLLTINPYKTPLCTTCRENYIRFPIPLWIKGFGAGILLVVLYGLVSFPKHIQTGIHYKRAMRAAEEHRYTTAQKEMAYVVAKEPNYLDAQCYLLIDALHNADLTTISDMYRRISEKQIENNQLFNETQLAINRAGNYYPSDSLTAFLEKKGKMLDALQEADLDSFLSRQPGDFIMRTMLASKFFDAKKYRAADSLLNAVLKDDPEYEPALSMKLPLKREMLQFDSSYYYADQMIAANKENMFAYASKVRTMLKQKKDDEAMALAKTCYQQDPHNGYTLATLALAYHFKGDHKNRDVTLLKVAKDTFMSNQMQYVQEVISGKEPFRN